MFVLVSFICFCFKLNLCLNFVVLTIMSSQNIRFAFYCRGENPLLKIFQLHVLSLTVLREAVYPSNHAFA
jgi:hypothetical protein